MAYDGITFQRASLQINRQCALQLGGAYHTTTLSNLSGIMRHGLVPGGNGDRTTSFLLPFGPWDIRGETLVKKAKQYAGYYCSDASETFNCRITKDGNIVTDGHPVQSCGSHLG